MIEVKNLSFSYPFSKETLKGISFSLSRGECLAVIGKTGSGKSTLLQALNGLIKLNGGDVLIEGLSVNNEKHLNDIRKKIGFVMQYPEYQLFAETVYEDVSFAVRNFGYPEDKSDLMVRNALKKVSMTEDFFQRNPLKLSGGEKRKTALAGVICYEPNFLLLDEPTAGLDPEARDELLKVFLELKKSGTGIIIVSHRPEEVALIADRVLVLNEGKVIREDTPAALYSDMEFLENAGLLPPEITSFMVSYKRAGHNVRVDLFSAKASAEEIWRERCRR